MNKKILIGSIIAVCVLVGVSFTSVVGYRSVASDVKASPLFNIRSSRAIDVESEGFTFDYVGKGTPTLFAIPKRDARSVLIQKFLNGISKMDEEIFEKFISSIIDYTQKNNKFNDENPDNIRKTFHILKNYDKSIPMPKDDTQYNYNFENSYGGYPTQCCFTIYGGIYGLIICFLLPFSFIIWTIYSFILLLWHKFGRTIHIYCP